MSDLPNLPPLNISSLLHQYGLRPSKGLGQNFLVDEAALRQVVGVAAVTPEDVVLEIGPGLGSLTRYLAAAARRVVAVELDRKLITPLKNILQTYDNVEIIQGDILEVNLAETITKPDYLVVANIPYYITSALMQYLLETHQKPARLVLTVQEEVAQRICAEPGAMSILALSVQVYGQPFIASKIPAGAFYPIPNVDSAILRVDIYPEPLVPMADLDMFFRVVKAGFSQKRKTLANALSGGMHWTKPVARAYLETAEIDPQRRAETLEINEWGRLVNHIQSGDA
ncbi:MAG: ribosomal RNA small subunit methyltransferase A [Anaerolineales bacterium]|nr:ribosomal RNA small subunit methyltransferase A [Anaerolineales bacterium]